MRSICNAKPITVNCHANKVCTWLHSQNEFKTAAIIALLLNLSYFSLNIMLVHCIICDRSVYVLSTATLLILDLASGFNPSAQLVERWIFKLKGTSWVWSSLVVHGHSSSSITIVWLWTNSKYLFLKNLLFIKWTRCLGLILIGNTKSANGMEFELINFHEGTLNQVSVNFIYIF